MKTIKNITITLTIMILMVSIDAISQEINFPAVFRRNEKSVAISKVTILEKSIKVDFDYLANTVGSWINMAKDSYIANNNGEKGMLIGQEGITINPEKTYIKEKGIQKFTLYFEKINIKDSEFHLIEDTNDSSAFNFYRIEMFNNDHYTILNEPKDNSILSYLPYDFRWIFSKEILYIRTGIYEDLFDDMMEHYYDDKLVAVNDVAKEKITLNNIDHITYTFRMNSDEKINRIRFFVEPKTIENPILRRIDLHFNSTEDLDKFIADYSNWHSAKFETGNNAFVRTFWGEKDIVDYFFKNISDEKRLAIFGIKLQEYKNKQPFK